MTYNREQCHTALQEEYREVYSELGDYAEKVTDRARERAISIITSGGFNDQDSDLLGDETGGVVQTHLMLAFMRQPGMLNND